MREYLRVSQDRSGTQRSPNEQHEDMLSAAGRKGWAVHPKPYRDPNRSASRYATKAREGFNELLSDLESGSFDADLLGIWESSRGSRRTGEWIDLIELCAERGVKIWVQTHDRVYDPKNARDRRSLREDASDSEYESDKTSERMLRAMRANAESGRPHGKTIYGYRRVYDERSRMLIEVVEHPEQAAVVREAAVRVLEGDSFYAVAKDFNERGIEPRRPAPKRQNVGWTPAAVKQMLTMPAYAGLRQHQGEILEDVEAVWEPLIEPEVWRKLQDVMSSRGGKRGNNWPASHLLGGIARCGVCGAKMRTGKQNAGSVRHDKESGEKLKRETYITYVCSGTPGKTGFHVAMKKEHLDLLVTEVVLARLSRPDFLARIGQHDGSVDAARAQLLDEIREHREWLEKVREKASEERNLTVLFDQERRINPLIEAAQRKLESVAATDPMIGQLAGAEDVEARWNELDLLTQRRVIGLIVEPRVHRIGRGWNGRKGINRDRVEFAWK
ncbi:site-specific DNA recombinase [Microbacterium natoriense]|uniref:Site-specific DNA recombinase n=1 Tax=Microbacterium natoriense TaxID=284570 RepID=A0AAW8EYJ1_9MICO|nr:recombinase family protein [Microbacterium natoriense]MDQ0648596.1 site-specific DNA recombinase [Microbacterium natoriense]